MKDPQSLEDILILSCYKNYRKPLNFRPPKEGSPLEKIIGTN